MDIALCLNNSCTKRNSCMRYRAVSSHRQSFGMFQQDSKGNCEYYWDIQGWPESMLIPIQDADKRGKQ